MNPQLCLGTAQFGLPYGITNKAGQVSESEVFRLLGKAFNAGVSLIDTAQAYGTAEEVLGRNLPKDHNLRLVTKLPQQTKHEFNSHDVGIWEESFFSSCQRLGVNSLNALLLHSPADLRKPGSHYLESWLLDLKQRGYVERLGLSIYSGQELEDLNPDIVDLVQLPLSLYDQRLLHDGTVRKLRINGIEIHARSLYLQGLLLLPSRDWPQWISQELKDHHLALGRLADQKGCRLIDLALGFAKQQQDLEAIVLGVCSLSQLNELLEVWSLASPWVDDEWQSWSLSCPSFLNPTRWPTT